MFSYLPFQVGHFSRWARLSTKYTRMTTLYFCFFQVLLLNFKGLKGRRQTFGLVRDGLCCPSPLFWPTHRSSACFLKVRRNLKAALLATTNISFGLRQHLLPDTSQHICMFCWESANRQTEWCGWISKGYGLFECQIWPFLQFGLDQNKTP